MTTIIVTSDAVHADGASFLGGVLAETNTTKMLRSNTGSIYAMTGTGNITDLVNWRPGHNTEPSGPVSRFPDLPNDWELIGVHPESIASIDYYSKGYPFRDTLPLPFALGSGGIMARALLEAGVEIDRIMRIVSKLDPHTGNRWTRLSRMKGLLAYYNATTEEWTY